MSRPSLPQSLSELPPEVVAFDAGPRLIKATVSMTAIAVLIVIIRFSVRLRASSGHRLGVDDWLIMLAAVRSCSRGGVFSLLTALDPPLRIHSNRCTWFVHCAAYHAMRR
jgi:hypothetical protein